MTYGSGMLAALLAVFAANGDTLRLLCLEHVGVISYDDCAQLLRAAPRQCVVEADAFAKGEEVGRMLRNEPPFQALRLRPAALSFHAGIRRHCCVGNRPGRASLAARAVADGR